MKKLTLSLLSSAALLTISACAINSRNLPDFDDVLRANTQQDGRACFRQSNISGWGALEDNVISVSMNTNREYYLVTTAFRCDSFLTSFQAQFEGASYEVCGGGANKIRTRSEVCPIKSVFKFDSRESAFDEYEKAESNIERLRKEYEKEKSPNN